MKTLITVLALSLCAFAQNPLKTIGTFTCYKQVNNGFTRVTGSGPVSIKNVSGRNIVAVVVKIDASCGQVATRMTYVHDMIFKAGGIAPRATLQLPVETDESYNVPIEYHDGTLAITPLFVQFEDGSSWGDATYIREFSEDRANAVAWINRLTAITDNATFIAELKKPITVDGDQAAIQGHLNLMVQQDGVEAVRAMISERLKIYNARITNGHF